MSDLKHYSERTKRGETATIAERVAYVERLARETVYDEEYVVTDILADLLHYADARDIDFPDALASAQDHHQTEIEEENA